MRLRSTPLVTGLGCMQCASASASCLQSPSYQSREFVLLISTHPEHCIVPESAFELLSGADALTVYTFNTHVAKHTFCKHCGIHPFYRPRSHPDCYDINIRWVFDANCLFSV